MESSSIYLYQCEVVPARNCRVDSIDAYLSDKEVYSWDSFQHIRIALDVDVTIPRGFDDCQCNYVKIVQNDINYYFFVNSARRNGQSSTTLNLSLDTINTFWSDLRWSWKTNIIREHRPRYDLTYSDPKNGILLRSVDWHNEGLNPVKTVEDSASHVIGSKSDTWYAVYTASNEITPDNTTDPVRVLLLSDKSIVLKSSVTGAGSYSLTPTLTNYYFVTGSDNANDTTKVTIAGNTFNIGVDTSGTAILRAVRIVSYQQSTTPTYTTEVTPLYYTGNSYPYSFSVEGTSVRTTTSSIPSVTITNTRFYRKSDKTTYYLNLHELNTIDGLDETEIDAGTVPALYSVSFSNFDRGNSRITKIIEIPYCPFDDSYESELKIDYGYREYYVPLNNYTMTNGIGTEAVIIKNSMIIKGHVPAITDTFSSDYESKIHSSEFEDIHCSYDNVSVVIKPENFTFVSSSSTVTMSVKMSFSNDMSGNKLFVLSFDGAKYNWDSDYGNYMLSTRSTEKPVYTSGYADYIKTGYNYDQESVKRQNTMTTISAVLSGITGATQIAGGALGFASDVKENAATPMERLTGELLGNPEKSGTLGGIATSFATSLIAQGIGQVSNIVSAVYSIDSNNRNFANELNQKINSSVNVSGQASTDLMDKYGSGNYGFGKVNMFRRTMRAEDIENVARMFHCIGYAYPKQEIPDFTSRTWFNYVQCEPDFIDENTAVYNAFLDDIRTRFKAGVTVFHRVNNTYDFEQENENWETALITQ